MRVIPRLKSEKDYLTNVKVENAVFTSPSTTFPGCYSFQEVNKKKFCFVFDARGIKGQQLLMTFLLQEVNLKKFELTFFIKEMRVEYYPHLLITIE